MSDTEELSLPGVRGAGIAVTGAASGIARAASLLIARCGGHVTAGDQDEEGLSDLEREATAAGLSIRTVGLDVSNPASVVAFVDAANKNGALCGVVCSAAIAPDMPVLDMTLDLWNRVLTVNLTGAFLTAQRTAQVLVERGHGGSIVTLGSATGTTGSPGLSHYTASKAGIVGMTKTLARELGPYQIRVNCVSPGGGTNTPMYWNRMDPAVVEENLSKLPLRRIGEPEDIAGCITFLLSDLSSWITGQNFNVNGGSLMY